ncbi:FIST signal transduction protein [Shewanella saliphila]|uniref:Histidine kinase n=1 Tax=Shewanella saliphila TaxID=2282698 RepID=A0ABQ2Q6R5_9GAMM|nr:FIST C-terminal domain-containing protein [Shewanella saliphila]MCL1102557.1 FIST C-terminal domain-containing protein [Shewanella saliphila]GGP56925.1 hypothetical protein GCM10009409_23830 [Shewanella saliphila]
MTAIFTNIEFLDEATKDDVVALIAQTVSKGAQYILVVIGSQSSICIESMPAIAASTPVPLNACVIPGVVFGQQYSYSGILILGFKGPITSLLIPDISASHEVLCQQLQQFVATNGTYGSAGIFVDGLSHAVEPFIATVYEILGSDRILIGAGVGDLNRPSNMCIANDQGCYRNAAILFCYSNSFKLQVEGKHDLPQVAGPYLVTEANANLIHSLNYQPAAAVFSDAISTVSGVKIPQHEIDQHINSYPFGLKQLNEEHLIRDIIAVKGNSLVCVGNVAENSLVYILNATKDVLIAAASDAGKQFSQKLLPATADQMRFVVLIDCISRALYLGDDYQLELGAICEQLPLGKVLTGVLSIGEIKNTRQGAIQFLNKTIVLGGL